MVSKTENVDPLRSIGQGNMAQDSTLEGVPSPAGVSLRQTRSQVAESIVRRLWGLYASRRPLSVLTLVMIDAFALLAGFGLSSYLMGGDRWAEQGVHLVPILLAVWLAIFSAHRLYDRASSRRSPVGLLSAVLLSAGLLALGGALYPELSLAPGGVLLGALFALPLEGGMRLLYERGTQTLYKRKVGLLPSL